MSVIVLVFLSLPAIAVLGESLFVRFEINNPYVNNGFRGWTQVQVDNFESFLIPDRWFLEEEYGIYKITDDSGKVWAFGAVVGTDDSQFKNYKDLITKIYDVSSVELKLVPYTQVLMEGSNIYLLQIHGDIPDDEFYCIQLFESPQKELVWILMPDLSLDETQYNIAEAMVFSFAFDVKKEVS